MLRCKNVFFLSLILFISSLSIAAPSPLSINFLDVGQADCILVQTPGGHNMLIDAGNNADAKTITSYLDKHNVKRLDVVVATHPHEDHIGSMDMVIKTYDIGQIYMPKVSTNTKTFEDLLLAIKSKNLKATAPVAGSSILLDPAVQITILAPNSPKYDDLNDYSIVLKIVYGQTSFLLTGDATRVSEREMLANGYDLHATILKVGHHGSNTSTTGNFLKAVSPKCAIISVGKDNEYGHPGKYTLDRLEKAGVKVYRTDILGTIAMTSDGQTITIRAEKQQK